MNEMKKEEIKIRIRAMNKEFRLLVDDILKEDFDIGKRLKSIKNLAELAINDIKGDVAER